VVKYWGVRLPVAALALPPALAPLGLGADLGLGAVFWAVTGSNVLAALGRAGYFLLATRRDLFARAVGG
jgi:Na+-driven multidrug efflux pump